MSLPLTLIRIFGPRLGKFVTYGVLPIAMVVGVVGTPLESRLRGDQGVEDRPLVYEDRTRRAAEELLRDVAPPTPSSVAATDAAGKA